MRFIFWSRLILLPALMVPAWTLAAGLDASAWGRWVHKLEVSRTDGSTDLGSAVSIAPGRVITNCHVVRNASRILLVHEGQRLTASTAMGDPYRDLCALDVPGLGTDAPTLATAEGYGVGTEVVAAGYSLGRFNASRGRIKGLFACDCGGSRVIQTSAGFEPGASGGGLFDGDGRLLGILTFKSVAGGDFHFAVPISWMARIQQDRASEPQPFWAGDAGTGGHFLAACALRAKRDWRAMLDLARDWTLQTPADPQAWMALGRARLGLGQGESAARDFQRVLALNPDHDEARWELQLLEFELDRELTRVR